MTSPLTDQDLYYLRSIKRNLDELHELSIELVEAAGWSIGNEVLADNMHWLDCFIDQHERQRVSDEHARREDRDSGLSGEAMPARSCEAGDAHD